MKTFKVATIALLIGGGIGFGVSQFWPSHALMKMADAAAPSKDSNEPLYWVAPMVQ